MLSPGPTLRAFLLLAWTDGRRRTPLAFLPYFEEWEPAGSSPAGVGQGGGLYRGVLFAWYAARQGFGLSFYPCRRKLITGKQTLGLSPLLGQTKAA